MMKGIVVFVLAFLALAVQAKNGKLDMNTAPMTDCVDIAATLDFYINGNPCPNPRDKRCPANTEMYILSLEDQWDAYCSSPSATPSSSIAPAWERFDGCSCMDYEESANTVIFGDFSGTSDTQGRLFIGGDAILAAHSVGDQLNNSFGERDDLVVNGKLVYHSGRVYGGNIVYGDPKDTYVSTTVTNGWMGDGNKVREQFSRFKFADAKNYYTTLSERLCEMESTGEIMTENTDMTFTHTNQNPEVYNMHCDDLGRARSFDARGISNTTTLVINFHGDGACAFDISPRVANVSMTVYNFCDAKKVRLATSVFGSLLAPKAKIVGTGVIVGQVVGASWDSAIQQNHAPCQACLPTAYNKIE